MTTLDLPMSRQEFATPTLVRSRLLSDLTWVRHGITTRVVGLGTADGNVGYTAPRDVDDAWRMRRHWTVIVGVDPDRIVRVRQVHGEGVLVATEDDGRRGGRPDSPEAPIADAIVTARPGLALMTLHADCLPILLADPRRRVVAAIHAGWRGTLLDVTGSTVRGLVDEFGSNPSEILAFVGPGLGVDHCEVGDEVAAAFHERWPAAGSVVRLGDSTHLDLKRVNAFQLERAGVPTAAIETSPLCTALNQDRLFSHRAQGATTGRFAAIIGIVPSEPIG